MSDQDNIRWAAENASEANVRSVLLGKCDEIDSLRAQVQSQAETIKGLDARREASERKADEFKGAWEESEFQRRFQEPQKVTEMGATIQSLSDALAKAREAGLVMREELKFRQKQACRNGADMPKATIGMEMFDKALSSLQSPSVEQARLRVEVVEAVREACESHKWNGARKAAGLKVCDCPLCAALDKLDGGKT